MSEYLGSEVRIQNSSPVSGGSIHQARRLITDKGDYFLKYNQANEYDDFNAEKAGLILLKQAGTLTVPAVIGPGMSDGHAFLLMEYIASGPRKPGFWTRFGEQLAELHGQTQARFGWSQNNFIGRLPQTNDERDNWVDFFVEMRLEPQLVLAEQNGYADVELRKQFEALYRRLPELISEEPPSLLHGDLWSGNFMTGKEGEAVIVDPAVYYGHREMEMLFPDFLWIALEFSSIS